METTSPQLTMWQRSTTRRFLRWLFSWRILRRCLIAIVGVVTLIVLFYTVENWRGRRAWEDHKLHWESKGEKFSITELVPSPVPAEQNFALTPLLKPLLEYTRGPEGIVWKDTNGLARLDALSVDLSDGRDRLTRGALGSLEAGTFADLQACWKFYRGNTNYPQPTTPGTAAADILLALGKFDPEIRELREAAVTRPYSRFPLEYDCQPGWYILLRHLTVVKKLCQLGHMRALARLELGQSPEAFEELKLGLRLSDSIRDEPILIDHLVRVATVQLNLQTLREGLVRHDWSESQLGELEKHLASLNLLSEFRTAMRGERALSTGTLDWLRQRGFFPLEGGNYFETTWVSNVMPSGWYHQNMLVVSKIIQDPGLSAVDEKTHRVFPDKAAEADAAANMLGERPPTPYEVFARMLVPALGAATKKSAWTQNCVDAARVACALERYRLVSGKLPETLAALTPRFIESIPTDLIDGKPLRYQLKPDGGYIVYSVGWNMTDDGGEIVFGKGKSPSVDVTQGDWVWQMPVKPITAAHSALLH